jgi:hypothetical protein
MRDKIAAGWWSQALHNYHDLYRTALAEGVTVSHVPVVNEEQIKLFEATLRQQLRQGLRQAYKTSKRQQSNNDCDAVLFVDDSGVCPELAQAAHAAGIACLQQILPEHTVMIIYGDQVRIGSSTLDGSSTLGDSSPHDGSNSAHDHALRVLWSAQEETTLHNSLQTLSRFLGITEKKLRSMVDAGQLKIQQRGAHLQFTCDGITAVVEERAGCTATSCIAH